MFTNVYYYPNKDFFMVDKMRIHNCRSRADSGSVGHGSNGSTNLDGSRGTWVTHVTHDPLIDDYVNQISRTISITFGIRPVKHNFLL